MLSPFEDRVEVVELDLGAPVRTAVDVTLFDTFARGQVEHAVDDVVGNPRAGRVTVYSWDLRASLVEQAISRGCCGYLDKTLPGEELAAAIQRIADGEVVISPTHTAQDGDLPAGADWPGRAEGLSAREAEVVALITQGLSNEEIARGAYLSINTVKTYIRNAYRKMGVTRRSQAVRWGVQHGMVPDVRRETYPAPETPRADPAG
ncbi:DNA-binding response regulator [Ornithinimicrobium avium]|uniref:DNA-binding response regulator n=2 Tax=Ornithinimicrobium avium TaxID=2283195 RepID=A0A345NSP5_9MICO|nr:DNA-binding response regulator [Ornithinimicrobium avium]